jgi:hypothetical protein
VGEGIGAGCVGDAVSPSPASIMASVLVVKGCAALAACGGDWVLVVRLFFMKWAQLIVAKWLFH